MAVIKYPLSNEKSLRLMEAENTLVFVVEAKANKADIKGELESLFKAKVAAVRTMYTQDGKKRAYVRFAMDTPAVDIATNLGII